MMNKIFHMGTTLKAQETEEGVKISGFASTDSKDRAGDVISPEAWKKGGIENYKKNPIILFNHNYDRPIGTATAISTTDNGLAIEAKISKAAGELVDLIKEGVLSTFSVSFLVKDAEYDSTTDIFIIKEAELLETSVVSVPCNQDATFSIAKSFDNENDYRNYIKEMTQSAEQSAKDSANAQDSADKEVDKNNLNEKENEMDQKELQKMLEEVASQTAQAVTEANDKKAAEQKAAEEKAKQDQESFDIKVKTSAEKLLEDIETRFKQDNEELKTIVTDLKEDLVSKSDEIEKIRQSKRVFAGSGTSDWKKEYEEDIADKYVLGLATGKGWNTQAGKDLLEKVNTNSGVEVSSEDFEQVVSTTIERDVQNELILAPMFREIAMNSATMILPVMPDAGYAEFATSGNLGTQTAPHGNLEERGGVDNGGMALQERTLTNYKLISTSYLGNETEEDAILPILPLIREGMVRSHARSVENAILLGNHTDGQFSSGIFDGLIQMAAADGNENTATTVGSLDALTAADLFSLRKGLGKYGLRPADVVYIVSERGYFELIEDAEFQDANLVGEGMATKIKGSIGQVFGSPVIVCDEFATPAADKHLALAVNTRNFLKTKLRGFRVESEYSVKDQQKVLVATQRIGFFDLIEGAASKYAFKYASAI